MSVTSQRVPERGDGGEPDTELSAFSSDDATSTEWARTRAHLEAAEVFWLSTVRPDGRPHVTPLLAVWSDDALYFCTSPPERKAKNLDHNPHCILTTGRNSLDGLDIVVEGKAREVSDQLELARVADAYAAKYPSDFTEPDGTWFGLDDAIRSGNSLLYRVAPVTAFAFGKGASFSQTRYRFPGAAAS
jgi:nitroimidazol reductase NimA-like FMN-containing flavoprotein (pyridoxamine 5'-phosphate oxidase superfamily)